MEENPDRDPDIFTGGDPGGGVIDWYHSRTTPDIEQCRSLGTGADPQQVEGGWKNLTIKGLGYQMAGVSVSDGELHLSLDASCLLHSQVCINDISLKDVSVVVDSSKMAPSTEKSSDDSSSGEISTPYPVFLRHLGLENINVKVDDTAISLASFSSGLAFEGRQLTLTPTRIQSLLLALPKANTDAQDTATAKVASQAKKLAKPRSSRSRPNSNSRQRRRPKRRPSNLRPKC